MSMKETKTSHSLLEEIASLSSMCQSGRLQITAGSTRGAFFFRNGKLVDARMGPFTGFPAVNLAMSMVDACLSFDPSIQPPSSSVNVLTEPYIRRMLRERFAIEIDEAEVSERHRESENGEPPLMAALPPQRKFHLVSAAGSQKDETEGIKAKSDFAVRVLPSIVANPPLAQPVTTPPEMKSNSRRILAYFSQSVSVLVKPSVVYSTREQVAAGSILLIIIIVTALGIASSFSKERKTLALDVSPPAAASAPPVSVVAPPASHEDKSLEIKPSVKVPRPTPRPSAFEAEAPLQNNRTDSLPADAPAGYEISTPPAKLEVRASDEKSPANLTSRGIAVVIQVDEGHVTEAYIQNPQIGLGATEATALRLARQRRFPEGTKGKQTIILRVTSETIKEVP